MNGIIIAAGIGLRMKHLTATRPKCMLPIAGRPMLDHQVERLRAVGCEKIIIVTGYRAEQIIAPGCILVENGDYQTNNILHSLMKARDYLAGDVICSYGDIWVEPFIFDRLMAASGDIVPAIDTDWEYNYQSRSDNLFEDAEKIFLNDDGTMRKSGRHLNPAHADGHICGEFLGLWRMTPAGCETFVSTFDDVNQSLTSDVPFQNAAQWRNAYITDLFQELVERNKTIGSSVTERGWAEFDTMQDYERLDAIAEGQKLMTIVNHR